MLCGLDHSQWNSLVPPSLFRSSILTQESSVSSLLQTLKASTRLSEIWCTHHYILNCGLEQNTSLGNGLLEMYGLCSLPDEVCACFHRLKEKNSISWNLVIRSCARDATLGSDALRLFDIILRESVVPSKCILASVLSACCTYDTVVDGRLLHSIAICHSFENDVFVGTALIGMYRRFQSQEDGQATFKMIADHNAACWNVMAALIAQVDAANPSVFFLQDMQLHAIILEKATFLIAFDLCGRGAKLYTVNQLHVWARNSELYLNVTVRTALMKSYGRLGLLSDAKRLFEEMPERDIVAWNALIALYAQQDEGKEAIQTFNQMQLEGVQATRVTLVSVLNACALEDFGVLGMLIHMHITEVGYNVDVVLGTSLVNMYGSCVNLKDALHVLRLMPDRSTISWNAMMAVCLQKREGEMVLQLFEHVLHNGNYPDNVTFLNMSDACSVVSDLLKAKQSHARFLSMYSQCDVVLGSSFITMYGACNDIKSAKLVFDRMEEHNSITFTNFLTVCADLGVLVEGRWLHAYLVERKLELDVGVNTALVNMYGKCGQLDTARIIFLDMPERNIKSWNAMLTAHTHQGCGQHAIEVFNTMRQSGMTPDEATFVSVLSACSHSGLSDECCYFFLMMSRVYCLSAVVDHYNCLLDMFGRAGRLDEAEAILKYMPITPTRVSWSALLGACQSQVDVERGAIVANTIFSLYPQSESAFVTLANIYVTAQRDDDESNTPWKPGIDCS